MRAYTGVLAVAVAVMACGPGPAESDAGVAGGGSAVGGGSSTGGGVAAGGGAATGGGAAVGGGSDTGGGSASGGGAASTGGGVAAGGGAAAGGGSASTGGGTAVSYCPASVTESHAYPSTTGFTAAAGQLQGANAVNGGPCTLGASNCAPANMNPWVRRVVNLGSALGGTGTGHPDARCNDGSPAVYWVQRGVSGTGSSAPWLKRWVMYLHAGGACMDAASCAQRWRGSHDNLMSNVDGSMTVGAGSTDGLTAGGAKPNLALNPTPGGLVNPAFWDANHVVVEYCSSDSFSGDVGATMTPPSYVDTTGAACSNSCGSTQACCVTGGWRQGVTGACVSGSGTAASAANACRAQAPLTDTKQLHFRGRAIVQAVLDELQSGAFDGVGDEAPGTTDADGFDKATEFLLSGTSAGGYGVFSIIDDVRTYLTTAGAKGWAIAALRVLGVTDAGFFINNPVSCTGTACVDTDELKRYDPGSIAGPALNDASSVTWSDGHPTSAGGRGDLDAYLYFLNSPQSPFAGIADLTERRQRARAESLKMDIGARGFITTPLLIQQSQIDLNQMGWQGLTSDLNLPVALPPTGEGVQGLLYDPAITADSDPFSSFTAHATANYALTGHTVSHSALCTPPATNCLGSKQAYANYFARKMREKLLATSAFHTVFSRVDSWHGGMNDTDSSSSYGTTLIANASTTATGGLRATDYPNDTVYFHNGAVSKDMVRSWYFSAPCSSAVKVIGQRYLYANKWSVAPPNFPDVGSAPPTWLPTNTY